MKHRALLIVAGLVGAGTLAASLSVAAAGTSRPASHATPTKSAAIAPPAVPNAAAIKAKYTLRWDTGSEYVKNPKRFKGFFAGEGNRTYIPNQFFDCVIPKETLSVIKVVSSIIRFSIGFQNKYGFRRQHASLSYQHIQNYAKIGDRTTLSHAIRAAVETGYVVRVEDGYFDRNAGKDSKAQKATYPAIVGLERSRKIAQHLTDRAFGALKIFRGKAVALEALAMYLLQRDR